MSMTDIKQKARELLADALHKAGRTKGAGAVLSGDLYADTQIALRAIEAALQQREPDAVSALVEAAKATLSHNPAHYDTDEESRLRAALAPFNREAR